MRIYTNEINGKSYISYSAAVLGALEAGFELVSNVERTASGDEDKGSKAVFRRVQEKDFAFLGTPAVEYGYISYLDTEDECTACQALAVA